MFLPLLLSAACLQSPPAKDFDGDGHDYETDCDDDDPAVHPGAEETWYDGVDGDCQGDNDFDQDGDGEECQGGVSEGCPSDHEGTDCDDKDAQITPAATEIWYDGVDSDCDGGSDFDQDGDGQDGAGYGDDCDDTDPEAYLGAPEIWYDGLDQDCYGGNDFDQDGDGEECQGGVSTDCPQDHDGTDCNDLNTSVYSGAQEIWDWQDNDCDGINDEAPWVAEDLDLEELHSGLLGDATSSFRGFGLAFSPYGADLLEAGASYYSGFELADDGFDDLLVAAPIGGDAAGTNSYAVHVVPGTTPSTLEASVSAVSQLRIVHTSALEEDFGAAVAWAEDVDGDSFPEIMVEAPARFSSISGSIYVFLSTEMEQKAVKTGNQGWEISSADYSLKIGGDELGAGYGQMASLGNLDGAEGGDLAFCDPAADPNIVPSTYDEGAVYLLLSPAPEELITPAQLTAADAHMTIWGDEDHQEVGTLRPGLGDIMPDGEPDLLLGAPVTPDGAGALAVCPSASFDSFSGEVYLKDLGMTVYGDPGTMDELGMHMLLTGGDLDGDGYHDVVADAADDLGNYIVLVLSGDMIINGGGGQMTHDVLLSAITLANPYLDDYPSFPAQLGSDFNGDEFDDLVLGAYPLEDESEQGFATVIYGCADPAVLYTTEMLPVQLNGVDDSLLAYTAVGSYDISGDGWPELLLGAPGHPGADAAGDPIGALYLLDPTDFDW